jgi:Flp pilus assembly protein protease CpaA
VAPLSATLIGALVVAIIASITDIKTGKIYNKLTFPAMLVGIIVRAVQYGMAQPDAPVPAAIAGLINGIIGCFLGMLTIGIFKMTIMRQFGGGDVKLMGALGAFVGPAMIFGTFLYYCLAFGVYTCTVMTMAFPWRQAALAYSAKDNGMMNLEKFNQVRKAPLPVAPFIAAGLLATAIFFQGTMQLFGVAK